MAKGLSALLLAVVAWVPVATAQPARPTPANPHGAADSATLRPGEIGATVGTVTPDDARHLGNPELRGVGVGSVLPGGPADLGGLRAGDVITHVNDRRVQTADELVAALEDRVNGQPSRLRVIRGGHPVPLMIPVTDARRADAASVIGEYVCRSIGSRSCSTGTPLRLADGGAWGWGRYNGLYAVAGGQVRFRGVGGAATWGPATIGDDSLTFESADGAAVWQKAAAARAVLDGAYHCQTAPGGCLTRKPIEIQGDRWSWGSDGGTYTVLDNGTRIRFSGLTSGPGGWGLADIGTGTLTFRDRTGESVWRKH